MTNDKLRLVSSGLDNSLSVWSIIRKNDVKYFFNVGCRSNCTLNEHT
jgi:hypothetical protein